MIGSPASSTAGAAASTCRRAKVSLPQVEDALRLSRYETALKNRVEKALERLERLQRARRSTGDEGEGA